MSQTVLEYASWILLGLGCFLGILLGLYRLIVHPEWTNAQLLQGMWPAHLVTLLLVLSGIGVSYYRDFVR